jgi:hemerythrin-like domain-containing protein
MATPTSKPDVTALIARDHRAVEELFQQFDLYDDTAAANLKRDLLLQISRTLSTHAAAEEQVVYPIVRTEVPGGQAMADEALADHQQVKETLARLERMDPSDTALVVGVKALAVDVRGHVAEEEKSLLPTLEASLGTMRLAELGEAYAAAKEMAPTHPHPGAPNTPPLNVVAGVAAGVVDRVRDLVEQAAEKGREVIEGRKDGPGRR